MSQQAGVVWFLRATEEALGEAAVVVLEGRVSNATARELRRLLETRNLTDVRTLIVDLSAVDYLNGAGLRIFETAATRFAATGCQLVVCGLRPIVRATFELAGAIPHLLIAASREDALASVQMSAGIKKA